MKNSSPDRTGSQLLLSLLIASFSTLAFYLVFPWVSLFIIFALVPVLSDLIVGMAEIPVKLLNLSVPSQDSLGYKLNVATSFWAVIVFIVSFGVSFKRSKAKTSAHNKNQG